MALSSLPPPPRRLFKDTLGSMLRTQTMTATGSSRVMKTPASALEQELKHLMPELKAIAEQAAGLPTHSPTADAAMGQIRDKVEQLLCGFFKRFVDRFVRARGMLGDKMLTRLRDGFKALCHHVYEKGMANPNNPKLHRSTEVVVTRSKDALQMVQQALAAGSGSLQREGRYSYQVQPADEAQRAAIAQAKQKVAAVATKAGVGCCWAALTCRVCPDAWCACRLACH